MSSCCQSKGQTILQHGESVAATYKELIAGTGNLYLPDVVKDDLNFLLDQTCTATELGIEDYHVYHDCGKPDCLSIDVEGKQHFPCHAMMSARAWLVAGGDAYIGRLIEHDMDMHTMKPADVESYRHMDIAAILLLTAWAELNSNAKMFGGTESISFKIKAKALTKLSKAIINRLKSF
jgi:hypothetical protein